MPAVEAFLAIASQWRIVDGWNGRRVIGLDYTAARAGLELAGIEVTPGVWAEVREIERGARAAMNGEAE